MNTSIPTRFAQLSAEELSRRQYLLYTLLQCFHFLNEVRIIKAGQALTPGSQRLSKKKKSACQIRIKSTPRHDGTKRPMRRAARVAYRGGGGGFAV